MYFSGHVIFFLKNPFLCTPQSGCHVGGFSTWIPSETRVRFKGFSAILDFYLQRCRSPLHTWFTGFLQAFKEEGCHFPLSAQQFYGLLGSRCAWSSSCTAPPAFLKTAGLHNAAAPTQMFTLEALGVSHSSSHNRCACIAFVKLWIKNVFCETWLFFSPHYNIFYSF